MSTPTPEQLTEAAERATEDDPSVDGGETLTRARSRANANALLLAQLGRMLAEAIGPEGRHASGKEDLAADLDLLVSRLRSPDLEALANSEAAQAIIDLRLAQKRVRMLEDFRRRLGWLVAVSAVALVATSLLAQLL